MHQIHSQYTNQLNDGLFPVQNLVRYFVPVLHSDHLLMLGGNQRCTQFSLKDTHLDYDLNMCRLGYVIDGFYVKFNPCRLGLLVYRPANNP